MTDDAEFAITYLTPERFSALPQVGLRIERDWQAHLEWLTTPILGTTKRDGGAWCPCDLAGGIVRGGKGPVSLWVADVDECTEGAIVRHAEALGQYAGAIIPTFSSTQEKPKHRIVLRLSRPIDSKEFSLIWAKFFRDMLDADILLDKGCKNINRLYFACVMRSEESWLGSIVLKGYPIPVEPTLEAAKDFVDREKVRIEAQRKATAETRHAAEQNDKYIQSAIVGERAKVINATEGTRHDTLLRAAYSLARFNVSESVIYNNLLDAFVACAGESRRKEGERSVHDAVTARHKRPA